MRRQDYTVAIICALPVELTAVRSMLDEFHDDLDEKLDLNCYTFGRIGKHNVVVACLPNGRYGVVSAAIVANQLLQSFPIAIGLMVGIAGGAPSSKSDVRLGDIVVSKPTNQHGGVIHYDLGKVIPKRTADGQIKDEPDFEITGHLNHPPVALLRAISQLESTHSLVKEPRFLTFVHEASKRYPKLEAKYQCPDPVFDRLYQSHYEHNDYIDLQGSDQDSWSPCHNCDATFLKTRRPRKDNEPVVHYGLIASGNKLMRHARTRDEISTKTGAMCFEMEAAGLMDIDKGFLVVRGICDYSDSHKNKIFQPYAAAVAAAYTRELLETIPPDEVEKERSKAPRKNVEDNEERRTCLETEASDISRKDVLDCQSSLYFHELEFRQIDIRPAAHDTCRWILEHRVFLKWLSDQTSMLWIKGKPGVGKSTLMDFIFNSDICQSGLEIGTETGKTITLSFFFHGRGTELQKTRLGLARSMLHQLLAKCPFSAPRLVQTYLRRRQSQEASGQSWDWTAAELLRFLAEMIRIVLQSHSILIFVDALDEGGEEEAVPLVEYFSDLMNKLPKTSSTIKVCFSCRHYPIICYYPGLSICVENENSEDIESYISQQLHGMGIIGHDLNNLRDTITSKASGVFQWVSLVVQKISKLKRLGRAPRLLQAEIELIPSDLEALYRKILEDLEEEDKPISLKLLQWVAFASVPLRPEYMRLALIIDEESTYKNFVTLMKDDQTGDVNTRIISLSGGIVEIRLFKGEQVVQFIHETARGFFLKEGFRILNYCEETPGQFTGISHRRLASSCIRYFLLRDMKSILGDLYKLREGESLNFDNCEEFAASERLFLNYTLGAWIYHTDIIHECGISYRNLTSQFGEPIRGKFEVPSHSRHRRPVWEIMGQHFDAYFRTYSKRYVSRPLDLLHLVAQHGWMSVIRGMFVNLLGVGVNADLKDNSKSRRTPLSYAAEAGQLEMVKLLLLREEVKPDSKCNTGRTPLSYCSKEGHREIVKLLLERDDVDCDSHDRSGRTPLSYASESGHFEVVELLLNAGADYNSKDKRERTPLFYSSREGREAVVMLLLDAENIDIDARDYCGDSAFFVAGRGGHYRITQLLARRGASINSLSSNLETPLLTAVKRELIGWTENLVKLGADINWKDSVGRTALSYAAATCGLVGDSTRGENIVTILIEHGADIHAKDNDGWPPMSYAKALHDPALIEFLRQEGEEFRPPNTPLVAKHARFKVRSIRDKKNGDRERRIRNKKNRDGYGWDREDSEEYSEEEDEEMEADGEVSDWYAERNESNVSESESEVPDEEDVILFGPDDWKEYYDACDAMWDDYGSDDEEYLAWANGKFWKNFWEFWGEEGEFYCDKYNFWEEDDDNYWQAFWEQYGIKDDIEDLVEEYGDEFWEQVWNEHVKQYCTGKEDAGCP